MDVKDLRPGGSLRALLPVMEGTVEMALFDLYINHTTQLCDTGRHSDIACQVKVFLFFFFSSCEYMSLLLSNMQLPSISRSMTFLFHHVIWQPANNPAWEPARVASCSAEERRAVLNSTTTGSCSLKKYHEYLQAVKDLPALRQELAAQTAVLQKEADKK